MFFLWLYKPARRYVKYTKAEIVAMINYYSYNYDDGQKQKFIDLSGKTFLIIGDSQSSVRLWQFFFGKLVGGEIRTHAEGGIGIDQMVDGEQLIDYNSLYSAISNSTPSFQPLSTNDVKNVDFILVVGLYNEIPNIETNFGYKSDIYPKDSSFCGRFNYMIARIKSVRSLANNETARIILIGPHLFGTYPYNNKTAYDYPGLSDSLKCISMYNGIDYCDMASLSGIDSTNWNLFQSGKYINEANVKYPENRDFLHLNKRGHMKVAVALAKWFGHNLK